MGGGLAAPLGAYFPIPHGVACGTLVAACTGVNIALLQAREPGHAALARYAEVGRLLAGERALPDDAALAGLVEVLEAWTRELALPPLSHYGMTAADIARVVANCRGSSMKTNPVVLSDNDVAAILQERL